MLKGIRQSKIPKQSCFSESSVHINCCYYCTDILRGCGMVIAHPQKVTSVVIIRVSGSSCQHGHIIIINCAALRDVTCGKEGGG